MGNFKVGDKVVKVVGDINVGKVFTVTKLLDSGYVFYADNVGYSRISKWYVLESVYNSPLYLAMKEEDE